MSATSSMDVSQTTNAEPLLTGHVASERPVKEEQLVPSFIEASATVPNKESGPVSNEGAAPVEEKKPRVGHIFIAPEDIPAELPSTIRGSIFLAGSIEQGKASMWQPKLTEYLQRQIGAEGVAIFNPRREKWNPEEEQSINNPVFKKQVVWELDALARADIIAMYLEPGTSSPISLLELGLFAGSGKLIVCCPDNFWRKGNVEVVCDRHGVQLVETYEDFVVEVVKKLGADAASDSPEDKPVNASDTTTFPEDHPVDEAVAFTKDKPVSERAATLDDATAHETTV